MAAGGPARNAALFLILVCCCLRFDRIGCDAPPIYGAVGGKVTLSPSSSVSFKDILWKKGENKVIDWSDLYPKNAYPPFLDRVDLDTVSGNLTICNLTLSDADEYEIESESLPSIKFKLIVLEPPPFPTFNCTLTDENITVHCKIPENNSSHAHLIRYSWHCRSAQCNNSSESEIHFGKKDDLSQEVQCVLSNELFKRTSSIVLGTCVPGDFESLRDIARYLLGPLNPGTVWTYEIYEGCPESIQPRNMENRDHSRHRYMLAVIPVLLISIFAFVKGFLCRKTEGTSHS